MSKLKLILHTGYKDRHCQMLGEFWLDEPWEPIEAVLVGTVTTHKHDNYCNISRRYFFFIESGLFHLCIVHSPIPNCSSLVILKWISKIIIV